MQNTEQKLKKKKTSKKTLTVPSSNLGFLIKLNSDIIDPRNIKKKHNHHKKKYTQKSNKQHYLTRLRMVIDINQLPLQTQHHLFKVKAKSDWKYVKKVYYRTREQTHCNICLQHHIIAPQITFCGHIYCFHCILTHFRISKNCCICPVCKEITDKDELRTCEIKYDCQLHVNQPVTLELKYRQGQYIYDGDTLTEDLNCADIIRMRTKGIVPIFQLQLEQIKKQLSITSQNDRNYQYLMEAVAISTQKLEDLKKIAMIHTQVHLRQNQIIKNQTIYRYITQEQNNKLLTFYQQKSGSLIYLHKLSKKYMDLHSPLSPSITSTILYKQQIDFEQQYHSYKQIPILHNNLQISSIIIDISKYTTSDKLVQFNHEFEELLKTRERELKQQQLELQRLRIQYQEDQSYMRKLKEQEQSEFYYDVRLSPTLDPKDINQQSFPSLIRDVGNQFVNTQPQKQKQIHDNVPVIVEQDKQQQIQIQVQKEIEYGQQPEQFPQLSQLSSSKSEPAKPMKNGKKKKKGKFIDVTQEILFHRDQQTYE